MATSHALLIGGGLFTLALVVMTARCVRHVPRLVAALLIALITSAGSALYDTEGYSGTGVRVSRGFPQPFHFYWRGGSEERSDINFLFFLGNTAVHFGLWSLAAAVMPRVRRDDPAAAAPHMVILRIILGIFFLILAVIGGLVPILQGWIFFLLALLVLFPKAKFTEKILVKAQPKVPRVVAFLRRSGIGIDQE